MSSETSHSPRTGADRDGSHAGKADRLTPATPEARSDSSTTSPAMGGSPAQPAPRTKSKSSVWSNPWLQAFAMLVLGAITATAWLWWTTPTLTIDYPQLLGLVGVGAPGAEWGPTEPTPATVVERSILGNERPVRVLSVSGLRIDAERVVGEATVESAANGTPSGDTAPEADRSTRTVSFQTPLDGTGAAAEDLIGALRRSPRTDWMFADRTSWWPGLWTIALTVIVLGTLLILGTKLASGQPLTFGFGRHRGRIYKLDNDPVTFDDVAGIDEAVEEVKEVVDFLTHPEKYHRLGGKIPKGVLLVGPPGTGKTLLAKAIAGEAGVPFISMSGSDFVEMYAGVGAARVRDVFEQARAKAPCIIFIDELDALGKNRNDSVGGSGEEREQTLNALLVEMDGFDGREGVIMVAATNRPEILDPALMRPGRFDRQVVVGRPDLRGREAILKVHASDVRLGDDVNLQDIASLTPGFVGADLSNLINEAALLAARKGRDAVTSADVHEGIERLVAGLEKKQRHMDEAIKRRVAGHEAGHAILAACLEDTPPVHKVSIIPRGVAAGGFTMQKPGGDRYLQTRRELFTSIEVLLGGTLAEELLFGDISTGASNDLERATSIASAMVVEYGMSRMGRISYGDGGSPFLASTGAAPKRSMSSRTAREVDIEVRRILAEATEQARSLLQSRRAALVAVTDRLIEIETVTGDELDAIMAAHPAQPMSPDSSSQPDSNGATTDGTSPEQTDSPIYTLPKAKQLATPISDFES